MCAISDEFPIEEVHHNTNPGVCAAPPGQIIADDPFVEYFVPSTEVILDTEFLTEFTQISSYLVLVVFADTLSSFGDAHDVIL
ncbi:hypothetical protein D3C85_1556820 [compost metagenome]